MFKWLKHFFGIRNHEPTEKPPMNSDQENPSPPPLPTPPVSKPVHAGETTRLYALPAPAAPAAPKPKVARPKKPKAAKPKKAVAERRYRVYGSDGHEEILVFNDRPKGRKRRHDWWDERGEWTYGSFKIAHDELEPGTIEGDRATRKKGIWEAQMVESLGKLQIYITCPKCGAIGNASDHRISKDGVLSPCIVCSDKKCDTHLFVKLRGYTLGEREPHYKDWSEKKEGERVEREGVKLSEIDPRYLREDKDLWNGMM